MKLFLKLILATAILLPAFSNAGKWTDEDYIRAQNLQKIGVEGIYFNEVYRADQKVTPRNPEYNGQERCAGTSIVFLLKGDGFSRLHKQKFDETWSYTDGSPLKIYEIDRNGNLKTTILGLPYMANDAIQQYTVKSESQWIGAEVMVDDAYGNFFVGGAQTYPGFEFKDVVFAGTDEMPLQTVLDLFPQHETLIKRLTGSDSNES